ncbi:hypothetical protein ACU6DI_002678 [Vibrio navarrensis]
MLKRIMLLGLCLFPLMTQAKQQVYPMGGIYYDTLFKTNVIVGMNYRFDAEAQTSQRSGLYGDLLLASDTYLISAGIGEFQPIGNSRLGLSLGQKDRHFLYGVTAVYSGMGVSMKFGIYDQKEHDVQVMFGFGIAI